MEIGEEESETRPVLVTGAGGFVGGHVARELARHGHRVRGLTRRPPITAPDDPPIEWVLGDLRSRDDLARAVEGIGAVIHSAGWVSLGTDPRRLSRAINVEATRDLLDLSERAGVERFVYTSTLWTTAAGTADRPADESTPWNLDLVRSPYSETKREAERLVLARHGRGFVSVVLCPAMVVGPGDHRPSSTRLLLTMARYPVAILPRGGLPLVDARVVAEAHRKALELPEGRGGRRWIVAGPYVSYREMARMVARLAGYPLRVVTLPDWSRRWLCPASERFGRLLGGRIDNLSGAAVAGGFLRLHVRGDRADAEFRLSHPPAILSIFEALDDHRRSGRAPWLKGLRGEPAVLGA